MVDEKSQPALALVNLSRLPADMLRGWSAALGADLLAQDPGEVLPTARVPLVLVYDSVETTLATAMAAGRQPSATLAEWEEMAGKLLAFWRQRRRITFLLEADSLLAEPMEAAAAIAAWQGIAAASDLPALDAGAPTSPVLAALAALPRLSRRSTRRLCDELAAGGFCKRDDATESLDTALAALTEGQSGVPTAETAQEEAARRLGTSQADLQARLARVNGLAASANPQLAADQTEDTPAWQGLAAAEVLAQESELRRIQLLSLQEMLEGVQRKHATEAHKQAKHIAALEMDLLRLRAQVQDRLQSVVALTDANRRLDLELEDRKQEISTIMSSQSWRVTRPLRATRRLFSRRRHPQ